MLNISLHQPRLQIHWILKGKNWVVGQPVKKLILNQCDPTSCITTFDWIYLTHGFLRTHAIIQVIPETFGSCLVNWSLTSSRAILFGAVSVYSLLPLLVTVYLQMSTYRASTSYIIPLRLIRSTNGSRLGLPLGTLLEHIFISLIGSLTSPKGTYQEHSTWPRVKYHRWVFFILILLRIRHLFVFFFFVQQFIAVHNRRGDFSRQCKDSTPACLSSLSKFTDNVNEIRETIFQQQNINVTQVLLASGEFFFCDHAPINLKFELMRSNLYRWTRPNVLGRGSS